MFFSNINHIEIISCLNTYIDNVIYVEQLSLESDPIVNFHYKKHNAMKSIDKSYSLVNLMAYISKNSFFVNGFLILSDVKIVKKIFIQPYVVFYSNYFKNSKLIVRCRLFKKQNINTHDGSFILTISDNSLSSSLVAQSIAIEISKALEGGSFYI